MIWRFGRHDDDQARILADELGVSALLAGMLVRRGLGAPEPASRFLNPCLGHLPDPFLLPDMDRAARRLVRALDAGEEIAVFGDYDADGLTASSLLADFLESLGARVRTYIPHRLDEGYGLNPSAVERLARDGVQLIVTVDCGISDYEAAEKARQIGVDLIVTDHHQIPPTLPPALALINPMRRESSFPQRRLAGVGVAFFLAGALRKTLREGGALTAAGQPELAPLLGLVALGTIADVVPLIKVNRVLVRIGLKHLTTTCRPGLVALKQAGGIPVNRAVTARDVAFRLAPRLNAAGRLGSARPGLDLLRARDMSQAEDHAEVLEKLNQDRRRAQEKLTRSAETMLEVEDRSETRTIVLAARGWPRGVVGLAASKLAERYRRPAILLSIEDGLARGSGRSIEGFNIFNALSGCRDLLVRFGGHEQAAGLTLEESRVEELARAFEAAARAEDAPFGQPPPLDIETSISLREIEEGLDEQLTCLAPFGQGNPEPTFAVRNAAVLSAGTVGRPPGHLKLVLGQNGSRLETIGFGLGGLLPELGKQVSVAVRRHTSTFKGRTTRGWKVVDVRKGDVGPAD